MDTNSTLASLQGSSTNLTPNLNDPDVRLMAKKIEHVALLTNLVKSRIAVLTAKLQEVNECKRLNTSQNIGDLTEMNQSCKKKMDDLWSVIERLQLKLAGIQMVSYHIVAAELSSPSQFSLLSQESQLSALPKVGGLSEEIMELGSQLGNASESQGCCAQLFEKELNQLVERQVKLVHCIGDVPQKITTVDHQKHIQQKNKNKERIAKTKAAKAMINCILSGMEFDFEENPVLLDIKIKYRNS